MKNYKILSLMALVLMLALAGGASSLILSDSPADVVVSSKTVTAKAVNAEAFRCVTAAECGDNPCVPMTPEQCAAKIGVDVETMKQRMKECQNSSATSGRMINATNVQCSPSDCKPSPDCKTVLNCKTSSNCSSRNIDTSI